MNENTFVNHLRDTFEAGGYFSQREVDVGHGIADLVLVNQSGVNKRNCTIRKRQKQLSPLLNKEYFKVLTLLPDEKNVEKAVEFGYIATRSSLSKSYLKYTILEELVKRGYVKLLENKYYFKVDGWLPIANEIIAIEAKLKNWKRGFLQANRYKAFASRVYLAVPHTTQSLVDRELLRQHNIGLISFNTEKLTKKFVVRCVTQKPFDENMSNFAAEYFWNHQQLVKLV